MDSIVAVGYIGLCLFVGLVGGVYLGVVDRFGRC